MLCFNTRKFTFEKETRTFVQELSALKLASVPISFEMVSQWTGKTAIFRIGGKFYDADGDLTHVMYTAEQAGHGPMLAMLVND